MKGLTDEEVVNNRLKYGSNKIDVKENNSFIKLLVSSLGDPIIKVMLIALAIRVVLMFRDESWYETLGMLISILLSSFISTISEYGSNKSFRLLQEKYENIKTNVIRNGIEKEINIDEVVVNDVVKLYSGDVIPADGIIISGTVTVDEKVINGESKERILSKGEQLLKGCVVISDECFIKVNRVGISTVMGGIVKELNNDENESPMRIRLKKLAKTISIIGYIGAFFSIVSYLVNTLFIQNNYDMTIIMSLLKNPVYLFDLIVHAFTIGVTIVLLCVPEGLPMLSALVLSSNMKRMLKHNVLVRKPVGIETSGSLNVLLTDKTGTLTKGKMSVIGLVDYYDKLVIDLDLSNNKEIVLESLLYNSDSNNSTDKAINNYLVNRNKYLSVINKVTFNSKIKYSSVTLSNNKTYYKGAYEVLRDKIKYFFDGNKRVIANKNNIDNIYQKYTSKGYRVIANLCDDIFIGFIILKDEIREEAKETLKIIKDASIDVIMITGDDVLTAREIANELELLDNNSLVIDHNKLENMSDIDIYNNYKNIKVIARAVPSDKSRIAKILESHDLVVGMTGDGVNDAPALKVADVGFSLGSGTEVAKEASDIVILDDNIKSICNAILYGRTIFKSIRKFIIFQLTVNVCALNLSIVGPFIGITSPVTIMQMLWINMIMDTLAGLAYSYEVPLKKYLKEKPISKNQNIMDKYMYVSILGLAFYSCLVLVLFIKSPILRFGIRNEYKYIMTSFFSIFIFMSVFNAFNSRTRSINIFEGIRRNKVFIFIMFLVFICQLILIYRGGNLFRTYGLSIEELIKVIIISFSIVPVDIIKKVIFKKKTML